VQVLEIVEDGAADGSGFKAEQRAHARQHRCIEPIGFGKLTDRLGKAPGLARVDLDDGHAGGRELDLHPAMIGARRLVDDTRRNGPDPSDQCLVARHRVVEPPSLAVRQAMNVEVVFRDIDANGNLRHLLPSPLLVLRG
jgi:hypothetical protein